MVLQMTLAPWCVEAEHDTYMPHFIVTAEEHGTPILNAEKCEVKQPSITFVSCMYNAVDCHPYQVMVTAIQNIKGMTDVTELHDSWGGDIYRSLHTVTVNSLPHDDANFAWSSTYQPAF